MVSGQDGQGIKMMAWLRYLLILSGVLIAGILIDCLIRRWKGKKDG